jgi:hypothetical protein
MNPLPNRVRFVRPADVLRRFLTQRDEDSTFAVAGTILAVESYAGSVPTFTWQSTGGHVFAYLPPHALASARERPLVDFVCPAGGIVAHDFGWEGGGWGTIGSIIVAFSRVLLSVDWPEGNQLAHLCLLDRGELAWLRNSRFQIGGDAFTPPNHWRKARTHWGLPG